jgi:hypothetical protein
MQVSAGARFFLIHAGETPNAAYFSPWERRRLGGKDFCQTRM